VAQHDILSTAFVSDVEFVANVSEGLFGNVAFAGQEYGAVRARFGIQYPLLCYH
jgi:hypothetical protein